MPKIVLSNLTNLQNEQSVVATINENNAKIVAAIENSLSRDGTLPNEMNDDLDMNNHKIYNLAKGVNPTDAIRRDQIDQVLTLTEEAQALIDQVEDDAAQSALNAAAAQDARDEAEIFRDEAEAFADQAKNNFYTQTFAGDTVATQFILTVDPGSVNNAFITIDQVPQLKSSYTIVGTTLTFSEAPPGNGVEQNIEVSYGGRIDVNTPADGTVSPAKLQSNAVTTAKIADANVTKPKIAANSVDASKLDSGDIVAIQTLLSIAPATPVSFSANKNAVNQGPITTATKLTFTTEEWDQGSYYDAPNSRWTPPSGKYDIRSQVYVDNTNVVDGTAYQLSLYKNGSLIKYAVTRGVGTSLGFTISLNTLVDANGTDYFELFFTGGGSGQTILGSLSTTYFQGTKL